MRVLIACEESQRVCCAFRERGHEAFSCDIVEPVIDEYVCKSGKIARFGHGIGQAISEDGKKKYAFDDPMTARLRSKTFEGVAKAMADQWGIRG